MFLAFIHKNYNITFISITITFWKKKTVAKFKHHFNLLDVFLFLFQTYHLLIPYQLFFFNKSKQITSPYNKTQR